MKNKKTTINFTIDSELKNKFIYISNIIAINRSKMISNFIRDWVNKNIDNMSDDKE